MIRMSFSVIFAIGLAVPLSACSLKLDFQNVGATNHPPLSLSDDLLALGLDTTDVIDVIANDGEPNLEITSINVISAPPQVTVTLINTSQIEISSSGGYQGDVIIEYEAINASGQTGRANLAVNVGYCSGERLADSPYANSSLGVDGLSTPQAFTICSFEQFNRIGLNNSDFDKFFELRYNIDFTGIRRDDYNSIGINADRFRGNFNGQGFAFQNLHWVFTGIPGAIEIALFPYIENANFNNLTIENARIELDSGFLTEGLIGRTVETSTFNNINVSANVAATGNATLIAFAGILTFQINTTVSNSSVDLEVNIDTGSLSSFGGVSSNLTGGAVRDTFVLLNVNASSTSSTFLAGGITGDMTSAVIERSYATGVLHASSVSTDLVGGLTGQSSISTVQDSFVSMNISGGDFGDNDIGEVTGGNSFSTINNSFYADFPGSCSNPIGSCNAFGIAVDTSLATGTPSYFLNNSTNPPLNTWDFANDWEALTGTLPVLR